MSEFTVFSIPGSPYGRAVLATLEEKGAPYTFAAVSPSDTKVDPHTSRHPFGKVPAVQHGAFSLYETQAILRYLDRTLDGPRLTPSDTRQAALMDQVMNINDCYLFQGVGNVIVFHRVVAPRLLGFAPDESAIQAAMPRAHVVFGELERLLGDRPYFGGESVSLADLMVAPHLDMFSPTPEWDELTAHRTNLSAWLGRMNARASMQSTTWERVQEMAAAA